MSINGTLAISSGTYTATSATTSIGSVTGPCSTNTPLNFTAGTFNHGNGRLTVYGGRTNGQSCSATAQLVFPAGFTVYDFELSSYITQGGWRSSATAPSATTVTVAHNFYDYGHGYNFTVDLQGDFYTNRNESVNIGVLRVSGTTDQYYTYTAGSVGSSTIRVDKVSGTFQPAGGVTELTAWSLEVLQGGFIAPTGGLNLGATTWSTTNHNALLVSSGTSFSTNGGTIRFNLARDAGASASTVSTISVPAGFTFNNVEIYGNAPHYAFFDDVNSATTLVVNGNFLFAGKRNNANWDVLGNITVNGYANSGTGTIRAAGSANQTVTGTSTAWFSHFTIASTGGVVTLAGTLSFSRNFTYTSGTVDAGTSHAYFDAQAGFSNTITPGAMAFNMVTFTGYTGTFNLSGTMEVLGLLTISGTTVAPQVVINTGTILAKGDVNFASQGVGGTALIRIGGSANQTVSGIASGQAPSFEVASTGGVVTYSGTLSFRRNYTYTSGTVDASTATVEFISNGTSSYSLTPGVTKFNITNVGGYNTVYTMTGTLTANGALTFASTSGSPATSFNSGAFVANGNVIFTNYGSTGNATLSFGGAVDTTLNIGSSSQRPTGLVTVNKSGGAKVTMLTDTSFSTAGQDLTISGGTFDLGGYALSVADVLTVGAGATLRCNGGTFTNGTLANSGTINCPGYGGYEFNWTGAAADSNWNTAGNWAGGVAPSSTSVVVFNDTYCGANCNATIGAVTSAKGVQIESPYTGTIIQALGVALTVGTRGWTQSAGTFTGGDSAVSITGALSVSGGTYTATSGTTTLNGALTIGVGATHSHSNGSTVFAGSTTRTLSLGGHPLYDVTFYPGGSATTTAFSGTFYVDRNLTVIDDGAGFGSGTIDVKGNVTASTWGFDTTAGQLVNVKLTGSGAQTVTSGATLPFPSLEFASTGTVTLSGIVPVRGHLKYTSGTVAAGSSTIQFAPTTAGTSINLGSVVLNHFSFVTAVGSATITGTLNIGGDLTVLNDALGVTGAIAATGNVSISSLGFDSSSTGLSLSMVGTSVGSTFTHSGGTIVRGPITVNKTGGGSVVLASNVNFNGANQDLTITAGTLDMAGYNLTVARNISNSGTLKRGDSPTCGTVSQGGTYSGNAAICP